MGALAAEEAAEGQKLPLLAEIEEE